MIDLDIVTTLAVSLGLGLLVGLQREYADKTMAGIRTFSLVTLLGSVMALIGQSFENGWIISTMGIGIAILFATANFIKNKQSDHSIGQTTEIAVLLMYGLGAYLVVGDLKIGVIIGAVTALLLHSKSFLESFVDKISQNVIKAIMQFVAISLVILPVLPNKTYGPYDVLNPYEIWLMVVLIVGLGLAGYFVYKWFGKNVGTVSSGILGGLVSSTATTVTFSKRTKNTQGISSLAAFIIAAASTVALVRILIEVSVITPSNLGVIAPPIIAEMLIMVVLCALLFWKNQEKDDGSIPEPENPAQLKTALIFAFLYGIILLGVAAAKDFFGQSGLYVIAFISGLTDVDAITLSLSNTLNRGEITAVTTWKLILLASLSNLVFKGAMVISLGTKKLRRIVAVIFGIAMVAGLLIIWLWPENWAF